MIFALKLKFCSKKKALKSYYVLSLITNIDNI